MKRGVRGQGADQIHAKGSQFRKRGFDGFDFFPAEFSGLAGVGIQTANENTGPFDAEAAAQVPIQNHKHFKQPFTGDRGRHLFQGQMGRGEGHAQTRSRQHHDAGFAAAKPRKEFGMAGKTDNLPD